MAQKLQIVPAKDCLVTLLTTALAGYAVAVDVREVGPKDFDDQGNLVLQKAAVRVRFGQADYSQVRDTTKTTLSAAIAFQIICRHESLRSNSEQRDRALELASAVADALAGARLLLPDGTLSEPIGLLAILPVEDRGGVVQDCYGVSIEVPGYAQFAGTYASGVAA
jgi:hypothetical protein